MSYVSEQQNMIADALERSDALHYGEAQIDRAHYLRLAGAAIAAIDEYDDACALARLREDMAYREEFIERERDE